MKKNKRSLYSIFITLIILAGMTWGIISLVKYIKSKEGPYDTFAQCLTEQGAVFYGAFWCPNCQEQKMMFRRSQKFITYVECSTVDRRGQQPICQEKQIEAYPTWEFSDESRVTGTQSLMTLSEKTGCVLPTN